MPKAKKITTNKKEKVSDDKGLDNAKNTDQLDPKEDEEESSTKVIDPDLIAGEEDVVTGFGIEDEEEDDLSSKEDEEDIEEEAYDPFGDRFEQ